MRPSPLLLYGDPNRVVDLYYATGFKAPDAVVFLERRKCRYLLLSDLEYDRARREADVNRVFLLRRVAARAKKRFGRPPGMARIIAEFVRHFGHRAIYVSGEFPAGTYVKLRNLGIRVRLARRPLFPERMIKRPDEVRKIQEAQEAAEAALADALRVLRRARVRGPRLYLKGRALTSQDLHRVIQRSLLDRGFTGAPIVAGGAQACDPHHHGKGPLPANQAIVFDIFPRSQETLYHGDLSRTFVRGRPSERLRRLYETVVEGQRIALSLVKDQAEAGAIHQAVQKWFKENGYKTGTRNGRRVGFFHGTGHGVGLEIHEPPRISTGAAKEETLKENQVVTIEPGLYYPGTGGVRIEDTVLVTKSGHRNLTTAPKDDWVL